MLELAKRYATKFLMDPQSAVILDLDETLFDNSDELSKEIDPATDDWRWDEQTELSWNQ